MKRKRVTAKAAAAAQHRCRASWHLLPRDVLASALALLCDDLPALVRAQRACKGWNAAIGGSSSGDARVYRAAYLCLYEAASCDASLIVADTSEEAASPDETALTAAAASSWKDRCRRRAAIARNWAHLSTSTAWMGAIPLRGSLVCATDVFRDTLMVGTLDGAISQFSLLTGRLERQFARERHAPKTAVTTVLVGAWNRRPLLVCIAGPRRTHAAPDARAAPGTRVLVFDHADGKQMHSLAVPADLKHRLEPHTLQVCSEGVMVATQDCVLLWSLETGALLTKVPLAETADRKMVIDMVAPAAPIGALNNSAHTAATTMMMRVFLCASDGTQRTVRFDAAAPPAQLAAEPELVEHDVGIPCPCILCAEDAIEHAATARPSGGGTRDDWAPLFYLAPLLFGTRNYGRTLVSFDLSELGARHRNNKPADHADLKLLKPRVLFETKAQCIVSAVDASWRYLVVHVQDTAQPPLENCVCVFDFSGKRYAQSKVAGEHWRLRAPTQPRQRGPKA